MASSHTFLLLLLLSKSEDAEGSLIKSSEIGQRNSSGMLQTAEYEDDDRSGRVLFTSARCFKSSRVFRLSSSPTTCSFAKESSEMRLLMFTTTSSPPPPSHGEEAHLVSEHHGDQQPIRPVSPACEEDQLALWCPLLYSVNSEVPQTAPISATLNQKLNLLNHRQKLIQAKDRGWREWTRRFLNLFKQRRKKFNPSHHCRHVGYSGVYTHGFQIPGIVQATHARGKSSWMNFSFRRAFMAFFLNSLHCFMAFRRRVPLSQPSSPPLSIEIIPTTYSAPACPAFAAFFKHCKPFSGSLTPK
nr:hypothetical protein Iba_chr02cCG16950 [Ipomoea batatas]